MRQSWSEIRRKAHDFADRWSEARYERGETQTFYNEFFTMFGVSLRRVATFEEPVKRLGGARGYIDLFWKGVLLVEQKSAGRDLKPAKQQAFDYFPGIREVDLPRFVLLSDFMNFELYDLDEGTEVKFQLAELPLHIESFAFILGVQTRSFRDQDPANIEASELMGQLHDALKDTGYVGHDLERLLVRLLFCLFSDAMGIFQPQGIFSDFLGETTRMDGADLGAWLNQLFDVLNQPEERRVNNLDDIVRQFPYVNGDLFSERLPVAQFDGRMRDLLLEACAFTWSAISPAIFGSLFQSVMQRDERRRSGAHYTTERNILKVIEPLFLDELRQEFRSLVRRTGASRTRALTAFHQRLASLRFFDPACGCGNFLIIAYRELRQLELELLTEIHRGERQFELDVTTLSLINVDQFYGIEISEFPVRIAEVAMWMTDHAANNRLSLEFGDTYARIPLTTKPHIRHADALEIDWEDVLPSKDCSYVLGNPPFSGFVMRDEDRANQLRVLRTFGATGTRLDFVAAWFLKAGSYVQTTNIRIGFVATNSITQGEQVPQLWPALFGRYGLELIFAHRTFAWGSDARGMAHVHVVIIGLEGKSSAPVAKRLFTYSHNNVDPIESTHSWLTAYLFAADNLANRHLTVARARNPFINLPKPHVGSKPVDGGNLIVDSVEKNRLIDLYADVSPYLRPFIGGQEFLNGGDRWLICVQQAAPSQLRRWTEVRRKIDAVKAYRENEESGNLARSLAEKPAEFHVTVVPEVPFLAIPEVSSERRDYVPIGWLEPPVVPSNQLIVIEHASLDLFGLLSSRMHMAWLSYIGGRLKSDFRYSTGLVFNTFPWPELNERKRARLTELANSVLEVRATFSESTLAELYERDLMKPALRRAHRSLDLMVDKLYRPAPFLSDMERVEHLFSMYERLSTPLNAPAKARRAHR